MRLPNWRVTVHLCPVTGDVIAQRWEPDNLLGTSEDGLWNGWKRIEGTVLLPASQAEMRKSGMNEAYRMLARARRILGKLIDDPNAPKWTLDGEQSE